MLHQRAKRLRFLNLTQLKNSEMTSEVDRVISNLRLHIQESRKKPRYEDKQTSTRDDPELIYLTKDDDDDDDETISDEEYQQPDPHGLYLPSPPREILPKKDILLWSDDDEDMTQIDLTCEEQLSDHEKDMITMINNEQWDEELEEGEIREEETGSPNSPESPESDPLSPYPEHQPDSCL